MTTAATRNAGLPLSGIRILDLTSVIMGPFATQMLAEYGADVVKLEPPEGDIMREMGPHLEPSMGPVYLNLNRGKRSVCLDLKQPESREVIARAAQASDVFVTNMRKKALAKLELDWDTLRRHNPRLVYVFLAGFAEHGPDAGRPAYDDLIQGMVGLPGLVARAADGRPRYLPLNIADKTVGLYVVQTVLAALLQQRRAEQGQYIEVPMYETMASFMLSDHLGAATFAANDAALAGNPRLLSAYRRPTGRSTAGFAPSSTPTATGSRSCAWWATANSGTAMRAFAAWRTARSTSMPCMPMWKAGSPRAAPQPGCNCWRTRTFPWPPAPSSAN